MIPFLSFLNVAPFAAVAKRSSQGPKAKQGGYHDWIEWGDLEVSREIKDAAFSQPPGELGGIVPDSEGLHIVRVIERSEAHTVSFADSQADIKKKLQQQKRGFAINKYVAELRKRVPVWTMYDDNSSTTTR